MPTTRRKLLQGAALTAAAFALPASIRPASAQEFPTGKQISFVCAFPAGSGADIQVRYLADKMSAVVGQTIIVENKPGAGGNIAARYVVESKPDGFTLYVHSGSATAGNMHLLKNPPFDVRTALKPVASISRAPFTLVVAANHPAKNVRELTEILKKKGANASYGAGSTSAKIMGELYKLKAGLETVEVNYRTSVDSMNDLLSGRLDFSSFDAAFARSQERENRIRILAVGSGERTKAMPEIPTMREQGVDMAHTGWWGAFAAAGTPEPIVQKWNEFFAKLLSQKDVIDFHTTIGADIFLSTPKETHALLVKTVDEWEELVRVAKIPQN
jgi:tripartite-type tricarboxylate transporter receptor subunit TctC